MPELILLPEHGEGVSCESKSGVLPKESRVSVLLEIEEVAQGELGSQKSEKTVPQSSLLTS